MTLNKIYTVCFSPTATSRKVSDAVAQGLSLGAIPVVRNNLTRRAANLQLCSHDLAVFAVPVYGGHVPPIALERMSGVKGDNTPAVVVVVYGNRAFEHAAEDLGAFVRRQGFRPVACAAFVGEHSYSTEAHPIGAGRPDRADLERASSFGREVYTKLASDNWSEVDPARLKDLPIGEEQREAFVRAITASKQNFTGRMFPVTDPARCVLCGTCSAMCPTGAIPPGNELKTDPERCIRCCACVKVCPEGARTLDNPYARPLSAFFGGRKEPVVLL